MGKQDKISIAEREAEEFEFWDNSSTESPGSDSVDNLINKASSARLFQEKLKEFSSYFDQARTILELGGGQGWASCLVKRAFPNAEVTASDLSPSAVASVHKWEYIWKVKLDGAVACRAYETPFADNSFDLIFCFSAAHHFGRHRRTLAELKRLLRPGGVALYLQEPGCPSFIHSIAQYRVNAKRPEVYEDVLRYRELVKLGEEVGLNVEFRFAPTVTNRAPVETLYFYALSKLPFLQHLLPSTVDIIIHNRI